MIFFFLSIRWLGSLGVGGWAGTGILGCGFSSEDKTAVVDIQERHFIAAQILLRSFFYCCTPLHNCREGLHELGTVFVFLAMFQIHSCKGTRPIPWLANTLTTYSALRKGLLAMAGATCKFGDKRNFPCGPLGFSPAAYREPALAGSPTAVVSVASN